MEMCERAQSAEIDASVIFSAWLFVMRCEKGTISLGKNIIAEMSKDCSEASA